MTHWHYTAVRPYVDVSMPKFVDKGRTKYQHPSPRFAQRMLRIWAKPSMAKSSVCHRRHVRLLDKRGYYSCSRVLLGISYVWSRRRLHYPTGSKQKFQQSKRLLPSPLRPAIIRPDYLATHPMLSYYASTLAAWYSALFLMQPISSCLMPAVALLYSTCDHSTTTPPQTPASARVHVL
jgi:hypothetical protein